MAPLMFKDAFWGSDFTCHTGYDIVIQRLRDGRQVCKDMEELLKMRALAEEKYGKELVIIARKAGGHTEIGTLRASFDQLKTQIETIGNFHIQLSDILKEEVKKIETFRERQKEQRKKFESIMEKVQKKKVSLFKKTMESKKNYELRCKEADEAEQGAEKATIASKNSDKVRHRAKHCRQTANEAEKLYFTNVVQLESVRQDWEETHRSTCESYEEVRKLLEQCDIAQDNNSFIQMKGTGSNPPEPVVFECYYQSEMSGDSNGRALFAEGGKDMMKRCSDYLLGSSTNISIDNPQNSQSALPSVGEFEISDGGYAPLPGLQQEASLATHPADEDRYLVLYSYTAREEDELSVTRGDVVRVLDRGDDGWWTVEGNGATGLVPGNYLGKV
uniref:Proline-serine-threonine phosphatase interacting protein 1b n=1 Tax=Lates calcarifer TaxID=8187 RepID=A0A4W6FQK7_LATCA